MSAWTPTTVIALTYIRSRRTMPAQCELIHSSLSCRGAEGIKQFLFCLEIKPHSIIKTASPYRSFHRSWGTRLQYNVTGRSHRRLGTHLREEHSASGSCHPRWPPQGRRQVAGGEKVKVQLMCAQVDVHIYHIVWWWLDCVIRTVDVHQAIVMVLFQD